MSTDDQSCLGLCECGSPLADGGVVGVYCTNKKCPIEGTLIRQVSEAFARSHMHRLLLARIERLMKHDPARGTDAGEELHHLAELAVVYEKQLYPQFSSAPANMPSKYQRAIWYLQDIAALAGTTKRKQAGCEIAAQALAQLDEPRSREEDSHD